MGDHLPPKIRISTVLFYIAIRVCVSDCATLCSGLMYPDTNLGENARHGEVFDEQAKTYIFP